VAVEGRTIAVSQPMELVALLFMHDAQSPDEKTLRHTLAISIDRTSICSGILQGAAEPAAGILPNWMSGYGFVFSAEADVARARRGRASLRTQPWTVGYDSGDSLAKLLAERVALNAKDAGLSVLPAAQANADVRVVRIPLASSDPQVVLGQTAAIVGIDAPKIAGNSAEDLYAAEQAMLASERLIPLLHLPLTYAASPVVKDWSLSPDGNWQLADVWLGGERP
jgi:hypothetical protein